MSARKMHFITLMCIGPTNHHNGGWRHPESGETVEALIARLPPGQEIRPVSDS